MTQITTNVDKNSGLQLGKTTASQNISNTASVQDTPVDQGDGFVQGTTAPGESTTASKFTTAQKMEILRHYYGNENYEFRENGEGYDFYDGRTGKVILNLTKAEYDELVKESKEELRAMLMLSSGGGAKELKAIIERTKFPTNDNSFNSYEEGLIKDAVMRDAHKMSLSQLMQISSVPGVSAIIDQRIQELQANNPNISFDQALTSSPEQLAQMEKTSKQVPPSFNKSDSVLADQAKQGDESALASLENLNREQGNATIQKDMGASIASNRQSTDVFKKISIS